MGSRTSISTVLVRPLARALAGSPKALAELCAAADLSPELLADVEARVSPAQLCVAWAEACRLSGDSTLALRIADATAPGEFGIVEYVCKSAPTLRDALALWVRYLGILDDAVEVALIDEGKHTALRVVTESEAPAPASHELCFALVLKHARAMIAGDLAAEVRYSHRVSPEHAARHRAHFGGLVRFEAKETELRFPRDVLATPLVTADPHLLAILAPTADELRARAAKEPPLVDRVRRLLRAALTNDDAQLEIIAGRLGMTGRSLQRRLRDEGTSFQVVRDAVRQELADRYLGRDLSFAEISFLLGFSEPSAFFRAFKRWTGLTPVERRASLRAATA